MQGTAKKIISVEVPAEMAGTFAEKIRDIVGADGRVIFDDLIKSDRMRPGEILRLYREDAEYTQQELADKLRYHGFNSSQTYISKMENGDLAISNKMAKALGKIFETGYKMFL